MKKQWIILAIAILTVPTVVHANYLEKTAVENSIQTKVQHLLDTMYGRNLFSVNAEVVLGRESWSVNYTDQATVTYDKQKNLPTETYKILPGYNAIKNLSPNEALKLPFNSKITKSKPAILTINLEIVTSKLSSKRDVKAADKLITELLELNLDRGDTIDFVFKKFPIHKAVENEVKVGLPIEARLLIFVLINTSLIFSAYL